MIPYSLDNKSQTITDLLDETVDISYADGQVENIKVSLLFLLCTNFAGRKRLDVFSLIKWNIAMEVYLDLIPVKRIVHMIQMIYGAYFFFQRIQ